MPSNPFLIHYTLTTRSHYKTSLKAFSKVLQHVCNTPSCSRDIILFYQNYYYYILYVPSPHPPSFTLTFQHFFLLVPEALHYYFIKITLRSAVDVEWYIVAAIWLWETRANGSLQGVHRQHRSWVRNLLQGMYYKGVVGGSGLRGTFFSCTRGCHGGAIL